jgi:hypothetical protein
MTRAVLSDSGPLSNARHPLNRSRASQRAPTRERVLCSASTTEQRRWPTIMSHRLRTAATTSEAVTGSAAPGTLRASDSAWAARSNAFEGIARVV